MTDRPDHAGAAPPTGTDEGQRHAPTESDSEATLLRFFVAHAPAMIAMVSGPEHVFTLANPRYLQLIGRTESDVLGRPCREVQPPLAGQVDVALLDQVYATAEPVVRREQPVRWERDGEVVDGFVDFVFQPIRRSDGSVEGVFVHGTEVTEQVQARREAEEARRRLEAVLEQLPAGVIIAEAPSGRTLRSNTAVRTILGYPPVEAATLDHYTAYTAIHPDGRPYAAEDYALVRAITRGEVASDREILFERADGTRGWVSVNAAPIHDDDGRIVAGVVTFTDTTERKQLYEAEQAARATAERAGNRTARLLAVTAALAEAATREEVAEAALREGIAAVGAAAGALGVLTVGDREIERLAMFGYPPEITEATRHLPIDELGPVATTARTGEPIWLETHEEIFGRYPGLDAIPARRRFGAAVSVPLKVGSRVIGVMALRFAEERPLDEELRDLVMAIAGQCAVALERSRLLDAERTARADAEAAVRLRDDFLSSASHDLKTPITIIQGRAQLLKRHLTRAVVTDRRPLVDGVGVILAVSNKMAALIAELQDVAHVQIGRPIELHCRPTDLVALARGEVDQMQRAATDYPFTVEASEAEIVAEVDPSRLGRVLSNLLTNAVKYSPDGGEITVSVTREGERTDDSWATITVRDQGMGIPAADLPRVFERFHRGANVAGRIAGTGIGLTGARQIVEQHGGTITAESQDGAGSAFTIRLPLLPPGPVADR